MTILCACAEITASFIECFVFYMLFSLLFHMAKWKKMLLFAVVGAILCFVFNQLQIYSLITVLVVTAYWCFSSWLIFRQKAIYHFGLGCFCSLLLGCLDFLAATFVLSLKNGEEIIAVILSAGLPRIIFIMSMKGILVGIYFVIRALLQKIDFHKSGLKGMIVISCAGFVGYVYLVRQTFATLENEMFKGWLFLSIFVVLILILVQFAIDAKDKKSKLASEKMRNKLLEENYQNVSDIYKQNAKLYHDVNHHLNALYQLMNDAQYEDAKAYIEKISQPVKQLSKTSWTGINIVDVVLNSKAEQMKKKGITYQYNVDFPTNTNVLPNDICTIFANLLDNAIEATEKLLPTELPINVSVRHVHDFILIQVENPCISGLVCDRDLPRTTKQDKDIHGWGLPSVISAVKKYNGTFQCSASNEMFTATAMLFFEERE